MPTQTPTPMIPATPMRGGFGIGGEAFGASPPGAATGAFLPEMGTSPGSYVTNINAMGGDMNAGELGMEGLGYDGRSGDQNPQENQYGGEDEGRDGEGPDGDGDGISQQREQDLGVGDEGDSIDIGNDNDNDRGESLLTSETGAVLTNVEFSEENYDQGAAVFTTEKKSRKSAELRRGVEMETMSLPLVSDSGSIDVERGGESTQGRRSISSERPPAFARMKSHKARVFTVVVFGIISLCTDIVTDAGRGVVGQFLTLLSASPTEIGITAGCSQFAGYATRALCAFVADKTRQHWWFVALGYALLAGVALLGLSPGWMVVFILLIIERTGKAIRGPSKETISKQSNSVDSGIVYGAREALDRVGSFFGPMLFVLILCVRCDIDKDPDSDYCSIKAYRMGFLLMFIPIGVIFVCIIVARIVMGAHPERSNSPTPPSTSTRTNSPTTSDSTTPTSGTTVETPVAVEGTFRRITAYCKALGPFFWLYTTFTFLSSCGFIGFPLIAHHTLINNLVPEQFIPALFAGAMVVEGLTALLIGLVWERMGFTVLSTIPIFTLPLPFMIFSTSLPLLLIGVGLWAVALSVRETTLRAAVADLTNIVQHGPGYGVYEIAYGTGLMVALVVAGVLYGGDKQVWLYFLVGVVEVAAFIVWVVMQVKLGLPKGLFAPCCHKRVVEGDSYDTPGTATTDSSTHE
ncbi:MFS transporter [Pelomyxa schiedti]|nr:MFS transporter [Pelomyxa schiedti]